MNEVQKALVRGLAQADPYNEPMRFILAASKASQALGAVAQDMAVLQLEKHLTPEIITADTNRAIAAMGPLLLALCRWDALVGACPGGDPVDTILRGFAFALNTEAREAGVVARPAPERPLYAHIGGDEL